MRILVISTVSSTINAFLVPHIVKMKEMGYKVDIATSINKPLRSEIYELCDNIYNVPFSRNPLSLSNIKSYFKIKEIVYINKYSIVHTHTPVASFISRLVIRKSRKQHGTKVYYTAHGFHFYRGAPIKNWIIFYPLEKITSYFTDLIITINNEDYEIAQKKLNAKSYMKMPGVGIDLSKFYPPSFDEKVTLRKEYGFSVNDKIAIMVGELNDNKNQIQAMKAVKDLKGIIPEIKLLLVGEGINKKKYQNYIFENDLEKQIILMGRRSDVHKLLKISDVLISCSKREGLPVNVIEGMASGLTIIVSNIRGNTDLINNGYNGFVSINNNSFEYATLLREAFDYELTKEFKFINMLEVNKYSVQNLKRILKDIY